MNTWPRMIIEFFSKQIAMVKLLLISNAITLYGLVHLWNYSNKKFDYLEKELIECHKSRAVSLEGALNANTRALEKLIYTIETNNKTTR